MDYNINEITINPFVLRLWDTYKVPDRKRIHMALVADTAHFLADEYSRATGEPIRTADVITAALLHDVDAGMTPKPGERHPDAEVRVLVEAGLPTIAGIVRTHPVHAILDERMCPKTLEEKLLFLADKSVKFDIISVDERFALWYAENLPQEAVVMLKKAYPLVKALEKKLLSQISCTPTAIAKRVELRYTIKRYVT